MNTLKKIWVWLRRFRKRKGYGVHSPFAFTLIRTVINERSQYYAYGTLKPQRKANRCAPKKIDHLLFRLSNRFQPSTALCIGETNALSSAYIQAGCRHTVCTDLPALTQPEQWFAQHFSQQKIGMLFVNDAPNFQQIVSAAMPYITPDSVFVITGIRTRNRRSWWQQIKEDKQVGITFDLYQVGVMLFNHAYHKQHYIVNF